MKAFASWSSGKDSAFALLAARESGIEIAGVLTTITEAYDRVAMHGVRHALLDRQIAALNLPAIKIPIPSPMLERNLRRTHGGCVRPHQSAWHPSHRIW